MILHEVVNGRSNRLLAHLGEADQERLEPHLEALPLGYMRSLYGAHEPIEFAYFIESGVASLVTKAEFDRLLGTANSHGV